MSTISTLVIPSDATIHSVVAGWAGELRIPSGSFRVMVTKGAGLPTVGFDGGMRILHIPRSLFSNMERFKPDELDGSHLITRYAARTSGLTTATAEERYSLRLACLISVMQTRDSIRKFLISSLLLSPQKPVLSFTNTCSNIMFVGCLVALGSALFPDMRIYILGLSALCLIAFIAHCSPIITDARRDVYDTDAAVVRHDPTLTGVRDLKLADKRVCVAGQHDSANSLSESLSYLFYDESGARQLSCLSPVPSWSDRLDAMKPHAYEQLLKQMPQFSFGVIESAAHESGVPLSSGIDTLAQQERTAYAHHLKRAIASLK